MKRTPAFKVVSCLVISLGSLSYAFAQRESSAPPIATNSIKLKGNNDIKIEAGFTYAKPFMLDNEAFLFCHSSKSGETAVYNLRKGGAPVLKALWSKGWTNMDIYSFSGEVYLFYQKGAEGTARIAKLDYGALMAGTGIGETVYEEKWSEGWTKTLFFVHGDIVYFFYYKKSTGLARLNAAMSGGSVGLTIYEKEWQAGYTNFSLIENEDCLYFIYQKTDEGDCRINWMAMPTLEAAAKSGAANPSLGIVVYNDIWSSAWSDVFLFKLGNELFMFHHKTASGFTRINAIQANGTIGVQAFEESWTRGWTNFGPFSMNGDTYLFGLRAGEGRATLSKLYR